MTCGQGKKFSQRFLKKYSVKFQIKHRKSLLATSLWNSFQALCESFEIRETDCFQPECESSNEDFCIYNNWTSWVRMHHISARKIACKMLSKWYVTYHMFDFVKSTKQNIFQSPCKVLTKTGEIGMTRKRLLKRMSNDHDCKLRRKQKKKCHLKI